MSIKMKDRSFRVEWKQETTQAVSKEVNDLENSPIEKVDQTIKCDSNEPITEVAEEKFTALVHNKLEEEKKKNKFLNFFSFILNPFIWVMEAATTMVIALANARGKSLVGKYFVRIIIFFLIK